MNLLQIRPEEPRDYPHIRQVVSRAFETAAHSDGHEAELVGQLWDDPSYIPALSLVAAWDGCIAGHILFSRIRIGEADEVALAPLSVSPEYQRQGIGTALVREGHRIARALGYGYSVVLGDPAYYAKMGYIPADTFLIYPPFCVPRENFMAVRLHAGAEPICGQVVYVKPFGIG